MQRGLVNYRAGQKRIAVLFQRDGQALKPVCPLMTQMALEPDLIDQGGLGSVFGSSRFDITLSLLWPVIYSRATCSMYRIIYLHTQCYWIDTLVLVEGVVLNYCEGRWLRQALTLAAYNKPNSRARAIASVRR